MGNPEIDEDDNIAIVREIGIAVAAVNYRLAPRHPFPAAIDDCYAALCWLHAEAKSLDVLPERIAIGGSSAGGGLAAGLALMAHDRKEFRSHSSYSSIRCSMIERRYAPTSTCPACDSGTTSATILAGSPILQRAPGAADIHPYAAPARREDLSGSAIHLDWRGHI